MCHVSCASSCKGRSARLARLREAMWSKITGVQSADMIIAVSDAIEAIRKFGVRKYAKRLKQHIADNQRRLKAMRQSGATSSENN